MRLGNCHWFDTCAEASCEFESLDGRTVFYRFERFQNGMGYMLACLAVSFVIGVQKQERSYLIWEIIARGISWEMRRRGFKILRD